MIFSQENRQVSIETALGDDVLLLRQVHGVEQLSDLFCYQVDMISPHKDIPFEAIIGEPATIVLKLKTGGERFFNGVVTSFASSGGFGQFTHYQATLRPWAWLLTRSTDCRIFQNMTVIEILHEICQKPVYGGLCRVDTRLLSMHYPKLEYCVQYREDDFNFISRLLEHAGIYYFFKHEKNKHTMMLIDASRSHDPVPKYETIRFATDEQRERYGDERISGWLRRGEIAASGYELNDFNFEQAQHSRLGALRVKESIAAAFDQPAYQQYDYPGGYRTHAAGQMLAHARMEALHGQSEQISGRSNARGLTVGALFTLTDHPVPERNRQYLVAGMNFHLSSDQVSSGGAPGESDVFHCELSALGSQYRFRPPVKAKKQTIHGPQTAIVVGKAGEEIWTDPYGRVKLHFHWDMRAKGDETSSCWVRVSQSWAGKRWGGMALPRVGMEVIVEFLEGDPDQPLVTGCVYNSDTMPPYPLPEHQSRSTFKTNSTKGGDGFNELRFEDKKGAEQVFMQAEKDFERVVKHNDTLKVGFEFKEPGSQQVQIKHDQTIEVGHDQESDIGQDQTTRIVGKQRVTIGDTGVIEAKTSLLFKVGNSSILLEPAKLTIKSTMIAIEAQALATVKAAPLKLN
jgi:type VI secretion system secreted protein VgrG